MYLSFRASGRAKHGFRESSWQQQSAYDLIRLALFFLLPEDSSPCRVSSLANRHVGRRFAISQSHYGLRHPLAKSVSETSSCCSLGTHVNPLQVCLQAATSSSTLFFWNEVVNLWTESQSDLASVTGITSKSGCSFMVERSEASHISLKVIARKCPWSWCAVWCGQVPRLLRPTCSSTPLMSIALPLKPGC